MAVLLLVVGIGFGIGLRLAVARITESPPRAAVIWPVELVLAAVLGAAVGVPIARDPAGFLVLGQGLAAGLTAYSVASGALAARAVGAARAIGLAAGVAHFAATSAVAAAALIGVVLLAG